MDVLDFQPIEPSVVPDSLQFERVLNLPAFSDATLLAGRGGVGAVIESVNVMQIPTDQFAEPGQLLLTSVRSLGGGEDSAMALVRSLAECGIAGLCVRDEGDNGLLSVPGVRRVAEDYELPLVRLPPTSHLTEVQTAVLELLVTRQYRELREVARVREHLTGFALAGHALEELPDVVADLAAAGVWLIDAAGTLLAASEAAQPHVTREFRLRWTADPPVDVVRWGPRLVVQPITVGQRTVGGLVADLSPPLEPRPLAALQQGATVASLQLAHRHAARELSMRYRSDAVIDLLSGRIDRELSMRRIRTAGWDVGQPFRVLMISPRTLRDRYCDLLEQPPVNAVLADYGLAVLGLVASEEPLGDTVDELLALSPVVHIGMSERRTSIDSFAEAILEAQEALRVAMTFDRVSSVRHHGDIGVLRFLIDVPAAALTEFSDDVLAPLSGVEEEFAGVLVETLEQVIGANLNLAKAARTGGWHYNTLRYRVDRLIELLGPFPDDGTILDSVALALSLRRELQA